MNRQLNPLVPFFVSVTIAGLIIGLVLKHADPAIQILAAGGAVLLAHMYFFDLSEN